MIISPHKGLNEKANSTHFKELLEEYENIQISHSCLYSNLREKWLKSPRKHC